MKVAIIGASAAGLYASLYLLSQHPEYEVVVFEQKEKVGKKLLATGNGHANILNLGMAGEHYNHPEAIDAWLSEKPLASLQQDLADFGIATLAKGDLVYPLSYSAPAYVRYLHKLAETKGVTFRLGVKVLDYHVGSKIMVRTSEGHESFDRLIIACGGKSQENLGSDGSLFPVLQGHGYSIIPQRPSLCPVVTKEKTKSISGVRHAAKVSLIRNGETVYEEMGEVLFKDDGLSGIAVFNASAFIARSGQPDWQIVIDLFPELSQAELTRLIDQAKANQKDGYLSAILDEKLGKYCEFASKIQKDSSLAETLKGLRFHVDSLYPFGASQVTSGGVDLAEIDGHFHSRREPGVSFIGECLDVDGLCGGFNLGFALLSASLVGVDL